MAALVAFAGVVLVVGPESEGPVEATILGDLLILGNSLSFALFLVISKPLLTRIAPLPATALLLSFGTIWISIAGAPELLAFDLGSVSTVGWLLAAYIVLLPTAAAYLIQSWALGKIDSSIVALFIYLQPVIAAALSVALLGERLELPEIVGAGLIFSGVFLALRRSRKPGPAEAELC
jgi:drug/metabolite transporter (DMT)-like permease